MLQIQMIEKHGHLNHDFKLHAVKVITENIFMICRS